MDITEPIRRVMVEVLNSSVPDDETAARLDLEKEYGPVWDTTELSRDFEVLGFMAPFVIARRLADNAKGSMMFTHHPRFYFKFEVDERD